MKSSRKSINSTSPFHAEQLYPMAQMSDAGINLIRNPSHSHDDDDGNSEHSDLESSHPVPPSTASKSEPKPQTKSNHASQGYEQHGESSDSNTCRGYQNIILAVIVTTLPFLVIIGVLLGLILVHRVERGISISPTLQLPDDKPNSNVYLTHFSATQLTTLASWASNVATLVPGFLLILYSYRLANLFIMQSNDGETHHLLPTPYQLGLLLGTLDGKLMSLWDGLRYSFWKQKDGVRMNVLLRHAITLLAITSILGWLIWAADTWFHVSVSTINFSQTSPPVSPPQPFGSKIPDICVGWFEAGDPDDTLAKGQYNASGSCYNLYGNEGKGGSSDAYQIINSASNTHQVLTGTLNGTDFSFLAPAHPPPNLDFATSTFAVSSSCQSISQKCDLGDGTSVTEYIGGTFYDPEHVSTLSWNCSASFSGNYTTLNASSKPNYSPNCYDNSGGCATFFADSNLNIPLDQGGRSYSLDLNITTNRYANPFYMGVVGETSTSQGNNSWIGNSAQIVEYSDYEIWFLLGCEVTVYNLTYSWINSSLTFGNLTVSSDDIAALTRYGLLGDSTPDTTGIAPNGIAFPELAHAVTVAVAQSNSSDQLASNYAQYLSKMMLAFSATAWEPIPNAAEQIRRNVLVARVPKAPLFTLVSLCLLFVLLGAIMSIVGLTSQSRQTQDVQARLNVFGIIASRFEGAERVEAPVNSMDGRSSGTRIGMVRSEQGGWTYVSSREEEKLSLGG